MVGIMSTFCPPRTVLLITSLEGWGWSLLTLWESRLGSDPYISVLGSGKVLDGIPLFIWQPLHPSTLSYMKQPELTGATLAGNASYYHTWANAHCYYLLILALGNLMNVGFEKIILCIALPPIMWLTLSLPMYIEGVYKCSIQLWAAVGLFNSIINFILLITVNKISRRYTQIGLW